ncbi:MAG: hypothetical protein SCALA702_10790 [Melioribacteraceae bacterium]|nr:MAG: hypothetical protein SCALA702_10790 [Melioribacteraceae bacterium]
MKKILLLLLFTIALNAQSLEIIGTPEPGRLLFCKAENIHWAYLNDKKLDTDNSGIFVFGFDRNDTGEYLLKVKHGDGKVTLKRFNLPERKYNVQKLTVKKKYVSPPKTENERIKKEREIVVAARKNIGEIKEPLYADGFIRPVKGGYISSIFGSQRILNGKPKNVHNGLDIAAMTGTPVYAMADGVVRLAADDFYYSGNFILLDHGQGLNSVYLHLSKKDVKDGDKVKKGDKIGEIGSTGRVTGPHLHWGVQWYNKRVDPADLLKIKL